MKYFKCALVATACALALGGCASTGGVQRSVEQRQADRETLRTILEFCEVTITGNTQADVNASVLPSMKAGLGIQLGGTCKPIPSDRLDPIVAPPSPAPAAG